MPLAQLKEEFAFRRYVTAYVDLLGLSNKLTALDSLDDSAIADEDAKALAAQAVGPIELIRKTFRDFYEEFDQPEERFHALPAQMQQRLHTEVYAQTAIIQGLGDAIAISVPLENERPMATWRGVYAMVSAIASAQFSLLAVSQLLRGGIAVGYGAELYSGEVMGASLAKAVHIEACVSIYPRVVLEASLVDFLSKSSELKSPIGNTARAALKAVLRDEDGHMFVDCCSPAMEANCQRTLGTNRYLEYSIAVRRFIENGEVSAVDRHRAKYKWLAGYRQRRRQAGPG